VRVPDTLLRPLLRFGEGFETGVKVSGDRVRTSSPPKVAPTSFTSLSFLR